MFRKVVFRQENCTSSREGIMDEIQVYNVDTGEVITVSRKEAAAGIVRYARTLGPGTPACGEVERLALELLRKA